MDKSKKQILEQTTNFVVQEFGMEIDHPQEITEEELRDMLAECVLYWIEHNLEHLFSILYRLDVHEPSVHRAFAPEAVEPANLVIAQLIIDREKEKIRSRQKYSSQNNDDDDGVSRW
ncbi:MAG: hypothetical protein GY810_17135 [Aureispira sp.]|nr:hypothetical protein [Aureispira sp.]